MEFISTDIFLILICNVGCRCFCPSIQQGNGTTWQVCSPRVRTWVLLTGNHTVATYMVANGVHFDWQCLLHSHHWKCRSPFIIIGGLPNSNRNRSIAFRNKSKRDPLNDFVLCFAKQSSIVVDRDFFEYKICNSVLRSNDKTSCFNLVCTRNLNPVCTRHRVEFGIPSRTTLFRFISKRVSKYPIELNLEVLHWNCRSPFLQFISTDNVYDTVIIGTVVLRIGFPYILSAHGVGKNCCSRRKILWSSFRLTISCLLHSYHWNCRSPFATTCVATM
jgi:hypothetical protein